MPLDKSSFVDWTTTELSAFCESSQQLLWDSPAVMGCQASLRITSYSIYAVLSVQFL